MYTSGKAFDAAFVCAFSINWDPHVCILYVYCIHIQIVNLALIPCMNIYLFIISTLPIGHFGL